MNTNFQKPVFHFNFVRGDSRPFKFFIRTKNGENVNSEDIDTLFITCKKSTDNTASIIFQKTLEDVTIQDGYCHVIFNPQDTERLNYGKYYFDAEVTLKNGYRQTGFYSFNLTEETTIHRGRV